MKEREFRFGEYVWFNNEGWIYEGMNEDGQYCLMRPVQGHPFRIIEYETISVDEFEAFYDENGIDLYDKEFNSNKNNHSKKEENKSIEEELDDRDKAVEDVMKVFDNLIINLKTGRVTSGKNN